MLGFEWISAQAGFVECGIRVERRHLVPTGCLHAAAVVALTASACVSRTVLGQQLGLPVVHLDVLYWSSGWQERETEDFRARIAEAHGGDAWIGESDGFGA